MRRHPVLLLCFLLNACVSVSLPTGGGKRAGGVHFAPPSAFREIDSPEADKAWLSESTGNTISYMSDCEAKIDPTLPQMQEEAVGVLNKGRMIEEKTLVYNGREGLLSTVEGDLDGIPVKMRLLVFKKNSCNYTLMYSGVARSFDKDVAAFSDFLDGFRAP